INQHHDAKTVRPIAMSVTIDDRNSQSQKEDSQKVVVHNADEAVTAFVFILMAELLACSNKISK
ncbi:MAG: hypothetical protein K2O90_03485, partial [Limosilactobacillus sp.]|nr:hypothetical protein [Limosilactobacillus sp.]